MGKQSRSRKARICKTCGQSVYTNARGLQEHAELCERLKAINLELPGIVVPSDGEIYDSRNE